MQASIDHSPLSDFPLGEVCEVLNRAYRNYIVPIRFDSASMLRRIEAEDIDLDASRLLQAGREPAGVMLIARRGRVSRLAALGITPERRGVGLGAAAVGQAVAEARARGDERMLLEVIETNAAAIATYSRAGFAKRRRLVGYAHAPAQAAGPVQPCSPAEALSLLMSAYPADQSWQTSLRCFAGKTGPFEAFRTADAAALVDRTGEAVRLLAFAVAPRTQRRGVGRRFMTDLLGHLADRHWSIPATLPENQASAFLTATGWQRSAIAQFEMDLPLDAPGPEA